nr:hypothetical protein [Tanacetum cinerariifolium]
MISNVAELASLSYLAYLMTATVVVHEEDFGAELDHLLDSFIDVFEIPTALPPNREQDHKIVLQEGTQLINLIQKLPLDKDVCKKYTWKAEELRRKGKLVVGFDVTLRTLLMFVFHNELVGGHSEVQPNLEAYPGALQPLPIPYMVWQDVSMDFINGFPSSHRKSMILVVVDRLTKYIASSHPYTAVQVAQNDPRDFAKPVKAIYLPQDVPSTSEHHLLELKNQVQRLMEAHLASMQPTQVKKITSSCEICSGPHGTQYCMENLEQAFVECSSSRTDKA